MTNVDLVLDQATAYLAGGLADDALGGRRAGPGRAAAAAPRAAGPAVSVAGRRWRPATGARDLGGRRGRRPCCGAVARGPPARGGPHRDHGPCRGGPARPRRCCGGVEGLVARMREPRRPSCRRRCCSGRAWPHGSGRPVRLPSPTAWLDEASTFRRARTSSGPRPRLDGARPGGAGRRATAAGCSGRATSGCVRSTSTRRPSAARSCAPSCPATAPSSPSSAPGRRWRRATPGGCCSGPSGGAPPLRVPPTVARHDPATVADLAALRAQHQRLAEARATGSAPTSCRRASRRLEQSVRQRLLHSRGHRRDRLVARRR